MRHIGSNMAAPAAFIKILFGSYLNKPEIWGIKLIRANLQEMDIANNTQELETVFSTSAGAVYQADAERCLYLDFSGKRSKLDFLCLVRLKNAVEKVDIEHMLLDSSAPNLEIISICACQHCFVLNLTEILALRELLQGTFVMFKLNHLIQDCLYRLPVN